MLVVVVILAITATMSVDFLAKTESSLRADRAAREAVAALRYARTMSMSTGGTYGVEFDTTNKRFQVFQTTGSNVVKQSLTGGGTYIINLTNTELNGTTMTATITGDATNPYDLTYNGLGSTSNNGTVVFSFGGYSKTVTIPCVGEPTIQ
jgi:Tfp pilus assembly protein FimT